MDHRRFLLIMLFAAVLGVVVSGAAQACGCADATSVTMGYPVGSPPPPATMGEATPGQKQFACFAHASPTCNEVDLAWSNQAITGVTTTWPDGSGIDATFKLQNLPTSNSSFGSHWVKASVDGKYANGYYRLFFMPNNTDHPASPADPLRIGTERNWFYYWKQTDAKWSPLHWRQDLGPNIGGWTDWVEGQGWVSWLCYAIVTTDADGNQIPQEIPDGLDDGCFWNGIDLFSFCGNHENRHRQCFSQQGWWPNGHEPERDSDNDWIPDALEPTLPQDPEHGGPFNPATRDTDGDRNNDVEDYTCWTQEAYTWGDSHGVDWSRKGFQFNQ